MPTATHQPVLLVDRADGVVTLTLNRPAAMNALSRELRRAVATAFRAIAEDADVGAVIVTGNGRAFCAGLDLEELGGETSDGSPGALLEETDMLSALRACTVPVIGAVNGFAITGGFELALAWGLVNRVVAPEELLPACRSLARDMLSCDGAACRSAVARSPVERNASASFRASRRAFGSALRG
jgi:enoyl-CoA hydratase/carnithine racemase